MTPLLLFQKKWHFQNYIISENQPPHFLILCWSKWCSTADTAWAGRGKEKFYLPLWQLPIPFRFQQIYASPSGSEILSIPPCYPPQSGLATRWQPLEVGMGNTADSMRPRGPYSSSSSLQNGRVTASIAASGIHWLTVQSARVSHSLNLVISNC